MGLMETRQKRRFRFGIWIPALVGLTICAGMIGLAIVGTLADDEGDTVCEGEELVYGLTLKPSGFDPHIHGSAELGIPFYSVYDMLIYRHPQYNPEQFPEIPEFVPGLAESWEISEDQTTYTFYLRDDVTFHDGTHFNSDAVGVTFDRITGDDGSGQVSKAQALLGPYYRGYAIPKEESEYVFQILLEQPYAPLLDALSQPYFGIASPQAIANQERATYQWHQVGTGPYKLVDFVPGERLTLERNEDYNWGPAFYAPRTDESVECVTFRFYTDTPTRRLALEAREAQVVGEIPPDDAFFLTENRDFEIYRQPIAGQPLQFYFNTERFPTSDLRVRRALIYATNRNTIVETVFRRSFSPTAYGPLSSAMVPYYDPAVQNFYPPDLQTANSLLNNAGIQDSDNDGWLDRDGRRLKLRVVIGGWGSLPDVAALLQSQWREAGIDVEVIQVPNLATMLEIIESGDYNLVAFSEFGTDPSIINRYFRSDGDRNWTGYADPELDEWLVMGMQSANAASRRPYYVQIQERIMEQALILPIRDYVNLIGYRSTIDGLVFSFQGWWPLLNNLQWG